MVNALDDIPFSEHDLVPKWHQFVLHVVSDSCDQMYSVGKERIKQVRWDVSPVSKEFPLDSLAKHSPYLRIPVIHVGPCKTEHYNLSPVIANEMQLESVAPSHRPLPVSGQSGEYLVGIPAQIVAYGYHGGVHEGDASALPPGPGNRAVFREFVNGCFSITSVFRTKADFQFSQSCTSILAKLHSNFG